MKNHQTSQKSSYQSRKAGQAQVLRRKVHLPDELYNITEITFINKLPVMLQKGDVGLIFVQVKFKLSYKKYISGTANIIPTKVTMKNGIL